MNANLFVMFCRVLAEKPEVTQKELAGELRVLNEQVDDFLDECLSENFVQIVNGAKKTFELTEVGREYLDRFRVKNAVILAAEVGSRYIQVAAETPKGLLEVYGKPLIEQKIELLLEKGIEDIIIVTGYKKEKFEYLKQKYGVRLVYNSSYASNNNLASLYRVLQYLDSTYVLAPDTWITKNIFNSHESRAWHSCVHHDGETMEWSVDATEDDMIKDVTLGGFDTRVMFGPAYFSPEFSASIKPLIVDYHYRNESERYYWETVLKENLDELPIYMNKQSGNIYGFEGLRDFNFFELPGKADEWIAEIVAAACNVPKGTVVDIRPIKEGMTNNSFIFSYEGTRYIVRTPGEGTDMLIDRAKEAEVYEAIMPLIISDDIIYIDPSTGIKITKFFENAKPCNPLNFAGVALCMKRLRAFHDMNIEVGHTFDVYERIEFYESLWNGEDSCYYNYAETKEWVYKLKDYVESVPKHWTLSHIDSVADNFLFIRKDGVRDIRLIDWEYAGMQDAHIDIAMFAIYAAYDRENVDKLIDCYFIEGCPPEIRLKIYAYIAMCGLLWSNWCEYKRHMGVEFGAYTLRQYRYARDYCKIFAAEYEALSAKAEEVI